MTRIFNRHLAHAPTQPHPSLFSTLSTPSFHSTLYVSTSSQSHVSNLNPSETVNEVCQSQHAVVVRLWALSFAEQILVDLHDTQPAARRASEAPGTVFAYFSLAFCQR